jgi:hypothetical protein
MSKAPPQLKLPSPIKVLTKMLIYISAVEVAP